MRQRSKRYQENQKVLGTRRSAPLTEAVDLLKRMKPPKFDETVDIAVRLGIDTKKSDQIVRGAISLPHGVGKTARVICFAKGDRVDAAKAAGATEVGGEELAKRISDGWFDFDVVVAAPDMMGVVGRLGKVLGPQGKMPSPKNGTVTADVGSAVREFAAGKVQIRADAHGIVHAPVAKRSFAPEKIVANIEAILTFIRAQKPAASKGVYIQSVALSTSMGPGVFVEGV
ncbi:MAG: 50S ribosomal protein L1 [Planctomycetes bacterium]|nr:50S ribosomal protein L1 [Planctomycetota bacterium]